MDKESDQPLKIIILGAGKGGTALIDLLARERDCVEVVGVADTNPRAPGLCLARKLNIPTASSAAELIGKPGVRALPLPRPPNETSSSAACHALA